MNRRRVNVCEPLQVTGGSGFVGSHLVDQLMRDGHEVSAAQCLIVYTLVTLATLPVLGRVQYEQGGEPGDMAID